MRATARFLLTLIASLCVFRPQANGPGLPPAAGEHGPLVPEQGGHVRTGGARLGEELEEGMCQIQKVSVSPLVPGASQTPSRTTRSPPSRHRGPGRGPRHWSVTRVAVPGELLRSSQPQFAHVQSEVVGVAEAVWVGKGGRRVSVERASVCPPRPAVSATRGSLGFSLPLSKRLASGVFLLVYAFRFSTPRQPLGRCLAKDTLVKGKSDCEGFFFFLNRLRFLERF